MRNPLNPCLRFGLFLFLFFLSWLKLLKLRLPIGRELVEKLIRSPKVARIHIAAISGLRKID